MAFLDGNIVITAFGKVRLMTGFSSSVASSFLKASISMTGASTDDTDLYMTVDAATDKAWQMSGFSSTITSSNAPAGGGNPLNACTWSSTDWYIANGSAADKAFLMTGFSATISNSFLGPGSLIQGQSIDGAGNMLLSGNNGNFWQMTGFSTSVTASFTVGTSSTGGVTTNNGDAISQADLGSWKIRKHDGFTSSITASFTDPTSGGPGLTWDKIADREAGAGAFIPNIISF